MDVQRLGVAVGLVFIGLTLAPRSLESQEARVTDLTAIAACTNGSVSDELMSTARVSLANRQGAPGEPLTVAGHRLTEEWAGRYLIRVGVFIDVNGNELQDPDEPAIGYVAYWNGSPEQTVTVDLSFGMISVRITGAYRDRSDLSLAINPYGQGTTQPRVHRVDSPESDHTVLYAANDNFLRDAFALVLFVDRNDDGRYEQSVDDRVAQASVRWDSANRIEVEF